MIYLILNIPRYGKTWISLCHIISSLHLIIREYIYIMFLVVCYWYLIHILLSFMFRYLLDNQLSGRSSVEGYIIALQQGCRCVECKLPILACQTSRHGIDDIRWTNHRARDCYLSHQNAWTLKCHGKSVPWTIITIRKLHYNVCCLRLITSCSHVEPSSAHDHWSRLKMYNMCRSETAQYVSIKT